MIGDAVFGRMDDPPHILLLRGAIIAGLGLFLLITEYYGV